MMYSQPQGWFGLRKPTPPYSAIVCKDGSTVWAEDSDGKTIASGEAGVDDASVIQSAVNSVPIGKIFISKGVYIINQTISVQNHFVEIEGETRGRLKDDIDGTVLQASDDFTGDIIQYGASDNLVRGCALRNISVVGNDKNNEGVVIYGNSSVVEHVIAAHNGRDGIALMHIEGDAENFIIDVISRDNGRYGLMLASYDTRIFGISLYNNVRGLNIHSGGNYIVGFNIWGNRDHGMAIESNIRNYISNGFISTPGGGSNILLRAAVFSINRTVLSNILFFGETAGPSRHIYALADGYDIKGIEIIGCSFESYCNAVDVTRTGGTEDIEILVSNCYISKQGSIPYGVKFKNTNGVLFDNAGAATFDGDGTTTDFPIGAHGLVITDPAKIVVKVTPISSDAIAASPCVGYVDPADNTKIRVKFASAPASGSGNVKIVWEAQVVS